ncbi:hypothetical protein [Alicyclobacillus sp.]|uniref:hypothetical protein n=1 Tax=Alicyclobacillus sp. TaxID=61169 RepID=UPI0025C57405|nr:hypothetical protein [Alicyclobacillus sp.]MCL6517206.1 hypothetical protein [Alicyclobacillus sp.]
MERAVPMGGPGGVVTSQSPPFTVPMRYMLLGMAGFVLFGIDLAVQSFHLGAGGAFLPAVVALTHLLTLGSLLSFIMGAVYQLATVAFLIPIASERGARWNFWLYLVAVTGLIVSMGLWSGPGLMFFGTLATVSLYVYAIVIIVSVSRSKVRGPMLWFVISAHVYLMIAILAAWLMIAGIAGVAPGLGNVYEQLLGTHILLAVGGFFTFLVMGFSFKLLPMFTLSHGFPTWRQKWTFGLAHAAVCLIFLGIWLHAGTAPGAGGVPSGGASHGGLSAIGSALEGIGGIAGVAAFGSQLFDIRDIFRKRLRKKTEPPMRAVVVAAVGGIVGVLLVLLQLAVRHGQDGWQAVVTFYLLGWVVLTLMGYAYKIVPFLIWTERYSAKAGRSPASGAGGSPGASRGSAAGAAAGARRNAAARGAADAGVDAGAKRERIPVIADLIQLERARPVLYGFAAGVVVLAASSAVEFGIGAVVGSLVITVCILWFVWQLGRVVDPKRVAKELSGRD